MQFINYQKPSIFSLFALVQIYLQTIQFCQATFVKILLDQANGASCLDGSPNSIYFEASRLPYSDKFIIYFEGGAWCGNSTNVYEDTISDCYLRSQSAYGSSIDKYLPQEQDLILFNNDPKTDSFFDQYHKVQINYCDGTGHQGFREKPIEFNGSSLYFRGINNTITVFDYLIKNMSLARASQVIISGGSAGGNAVYMLSNTIRRMLPQSVRLMSIADSGIFLDYFNVQSMQHDYQALIKNFMNISNKEISLPNLECVNSYPQEQQWKCMFAQYSAFFVETPLFIVQSLYDEWSLSFILGEPCVYTNGWYNGSLVACSSVEKQFIADYHQHLKKNISEILHNKKKWGFWGISCVQHCFVNIQLLPSADYWKVPGGTGKDIEVAIEEWIRSIVSNDAGQEIEQNMVHFDQAEWPDNQKCSFSQVNTTANQ